MEVNKKFIKRINSLIRGNDIGLENKRPPALEQITGDQAELRELFHHIHVSPPLHRTQ